MVDLFDSILFPRLFFRKRTPSLWSSFFAFFGVVGVNLIAFPYTIQKWIIHDHFQGWVYLLSIPFLSYFFLLGIDLLFVEKDHAQRYCRFFGASYAPFLFFPIATALAKREWMDHRAIGWIMMVMIILWSLYLFSLTTQRKRALIGRAVKDLTIVFILYYWLFRG